MSFTITKKFTFEAAHKLPHHKGKCARLHGHSYVLTVELAADSLQPNSTKQYDAGINKVFPNVKPPPNASAGMVVDFYDVAAAVKPLVEDCLDHHFLNETVDENPTSERVALFCFSYLEKLLPQLSAVTISETCTSAATYRPAKYEQ